MKHRPPVFRLAALLAVLIVGLLVTQASAAGTLRYGLAADPPDLNPWRETGTSSRTVTTLAYNRLVMLTPEGDVVPDLAESWETLSPTSYVFHLRDNVRFSNGDVLTAEDVKYSLEQIMTPERGAFLFNQLTEAIDDIVILDDHSILIELKSPDVTFLTTLASPGAEILSKAWLETNPNLNTEMMGTGPFLLVENEPGVRVVMERNPNYFKEGLPRLDRIEFIPYKDEATRINALLAGELDIIDYPPAEFWDLIEVDPRFHLEKSLGTAMVIMFNPAEPPFDDARVRQAIRYLIPEQPIIDAAFFGHAEPARGGLIPPGHWAHNADLDEYFTPNVERAMELLKEAGYEDPSELTVTLAATSTYGMHRIIGQIVQDLLQQHGIKVNLNLQEWGTFTENRILGNLPAWVYAAYLQTSDPGSYAAYYAPGASLYAGPIEFEDPVISELLIQGRSMTDNELRREVYRELEEYLLDEALIVPLVWRISAFALRTDVKDFVFSGIGPFGGDRILSQVWLDR